MITERRGRKWLPALFTVTVDRVRGEAVSDSMAGACGIFRCAHSKDAHNSFCFPTGRRLLARRLIDIVFVFMYQDFHARDRWTKRDVHCFYEALIVAIATRHA